jgi:hypothetical protein
MALSALTITVTQPRLIDGWVEAARRNGTTPESIAIEFLNQQGKQYADLFKIGVVTSAAFMARFTPVEYATVLSAAEVNAEVKSLMDTLLSEPIVNFDDPRLLPGLEQLASAGLISIERVPQLMHYDRPAYTPEEDEE